MTRSARSRITGYNSQKVDGNRVSDLNSACLLFYDESAAFIPEARSRVPDALIVLRLILNSHWDDPELTGRQGARLCREYPQVDVLCPANEQNFENDASSSAIAQWCNRFNDAYALAGAPKPTVSPAMSTGRPFDLYQVRAAWRRFDYIGVHGYATLDDLGFTSALANIAHHREVWPDKDQLLTETNIEKLEETTYRQGEGAAAFENFLNKLAGLGYVRGAFWFLDDSDTWPYRLTHIPPLMDLYRRIGHETGGAPNPGPTPPPSGQIARVESIYSISHTDGAEFYLASLEERTDPPNISAIGPSDASILVSTADDRHRATGMGQADMPFSHPAQYQPSQGERGFYYATAGDARCDGLGWAYDAPPVMQGPHTNVVPMFKRRSGPVQPPEPPPGIAWSGAFADYASRHPEVGFAIGDIAYHPEPGAWITAGQVSRTHLFIWNGASVIALPRP